MTFVRPSPGSREGDGRIVTAGDLTSVITSLTLDLRGLSRLMILADVTRPAAGVTEVQMMQDISLDGVTWFPLQNRDGTIPPIMALEEATDDKPIPGTGSTLWAVVVESAAPFCRMRFTATAPAAGDVITVDAYARE